MLSRTPRPAAECIRQQLRAQPKARFPNSRFQSSSSGPASGGTNPALVGGVAGGAFAFVAGYSWYHFSGAKTLLNTSRQAQLYVDQAKQTIAEKTPEPSAAFNWFRDTARSYSAFIPGARRYVDTAFDDIDKIRGKHSEEFDQVVSDAYNELKEASKGGLSADTAFEAMNILQKHLNRLYELGSDAAEDIMDNHPQLKEKVGGNLNQLKEMGDAYGPQAKEEVNKVWQQISEILKQGASAESAEKITNLVQEKTDKLQKLRDEMWNKGMEEAKQYLEKNPKVKELVEDNAESLKNGDFGKLWDLAKDSASSGKTEDLEAYVKDKVNQAKSGEFGNLDKLSQMVPGGSNIINQLQSLQDISQKKGKEAKNILEETTQEIQDVLKKRKEQVEKLAQEEKN